MSTKDTFKGAKIAYTDFYAYINTVVQEIGMERVLTLMTKSDEARGAKTGKMIKEQSGVKEFDAKKAAKQVINLAKGIGGIDDVLEKSTQKVVTRTRFGKCPLYEAAKEVGLDDNTIEAMCRAGSLRFLDTMVKQLNPDLSYRLRKFRSADDGGCVEEIVLG
jgi:hypothetical protein